MGYVSPTRRIAISQERGRTRIDVPARKSLLFICLFLFWIVFACSLFTVFWSAQQVQDIGPPGFLFVLMVLPLLALLAGVVVLAWMFFGCDTLWVSSTSLAREISLGPMRKTVELELGVVSGAWWRKRQYGFLIPVYFIGHSIVMSYANSDFNFGYGVDETEAQTILDTLTQVAGIPQK